jgi:hypothetical protein
MLIYTNDYYYREWPIHLLLASVAVQGAIVLLVI